MKFKNKMSKKERKAYYAQFRTMWAINPITRKPKRTKWKEKRANEKAASF